MEEPLEWTATFRATDSDKGTVACDWGGGSYFHIEQRLQRSDTYEHIPIKPLLNRSRESGFSWDILRSSRDAARPRPVRRHFPVAWRPAPRRSGSDFSIVLKDLAGLRAEQQEDRQRAAVLVTDGVASRRFEDEPATRIRHAGSW